MKNHGRSISSFFIGLNDYAREKLTPFWTEMKQRGEAKRHGKGPDEQDNSHTDVSAMIEKKVTENSLVRAEDLEALEARVAVLEEKLKQQVPQ